VPTFGLLSWAAFGYLGLRLRRWAWIVAGACYLALEVVAWVFLGMSRNDNDWQSLAFVLTWFVVWVASSIHALLIRREALDRLAVDEDPLLQQARTRLTVRRAAGEIAREQPLLAVEAQIGRDQAAFAGLVDVNHASADEFALLPGFTPELAANVVSVRDRIEGFDSVLDFANVLDLPPRLVDSLRDRLICLPR
jgi:SARP family transcriptional regulator, regulator of embCAB operon